MDTLGSFGALTNVIMNMYLCRNHYKRIYEHVPLCEPLGFPKCHLVQLGLFGGFRA